MKINTTTLGLAPLLVTMIGLSGCGSSTELSCDEVQDYQLAVEAEPVRTPEGLDELDEYKRLPLPEASPRPPREAGSPCLDLPPSILTGEEGPQ